MSCLGCDTWPLTTGNDKRVDGRGWVLGSFVFPPVSFRAATSFSLPVAGIHAEWLTLAAGALCRPGLQSSTYAFTAANVPAYPVHLRLLFSVTSSNSSSTPRGGPVCPCGVLLSGRGSRRRCGHRALGADFSFAGPLENPWGLGVSGWVEGS